MVAAGFGAVFASCSHLVCGVSSVSVEPQHWMIVFAASVAYGIAWSALGLTAAIFSKFRGVRAGAIGLESGM